MTVKLHYQSYGQGKPVLILHGMFGSGRNWTSIARTLAAQYQAITVDLRNHGNSGHADTMTYPDMAADIRHLLETRGLHKAHMIGHSMGGKVAMTCALTYPALLDRLVILDIAPAAYRNEFLPLINSMQSLPLEEITSRGRAEELLAPAIPDGQIRQFLLQNLVQEDTGYRWRLHLPALRSGLADLGNFPAFPNTYAGPALFLGGSNSDYLHPRHHQAIKRYFKNAEIRYIENAGHWLHVDQPVAVLDRITAFLG